MAVRVHAEQEADHHAGKYAERHGEETAGRDESNGFSRGCGAEPLSLQLHGFGRTGHEAGAPPRKHCVFDVSQGALYDTVLRL